MKLLIRGGHLIDPAAHIDGPNDVLVEGGRIQSIGREISVEEDVRVVDARGKTVTPGFIDAHSHLRDPGFTHRETLTTGSRAAALGGYTSVIAMPNTAPVIDTPEVVEDVAGRAAREVPVNVFLMGTITKGKKGEEAVDLAALKEAGVVAFGDDAPVSNPHLLWQAFTRGKALGVPFCLHCEDPALCNRGRMNEGSVSRQLGVPGRPNVSEAAMIARDMAIGALAGAHLHILHLTTKEGVRIIRAAKAHGINVTTEVTPHHFTLTDEAVLMYGPNALIAPPLRCREDVEEIKKGLQDGTIDLIATDHAPHAAEEKQDIATANCGLIGLETAFSQVLRELVYPGFFHCR